MVSLPRTAPELAELEWPGRTGVLTPERRDALSYWIAKNEGALALIHRGTAFKQGRFPIDWQQGGPWQISLLHQENTLLQLEGLLHLEENRPADALESAHALFRFGNALGQEPFWTAQWQHLHCCTLGMQLLERILAQHPLTDDELCSLQHELHETELAVLPGVTRAVIGDRCVAMSEVHKQWRTATLGQPAIAAVFGQISAGHDRALLTYLTTSEGTLEVLQRTGPGPLPFSSGLVPSGGAIAAQWELVVRLQAAQAGLCLERFRAAHQGRIPESLDEAIPEFLAAMPVDPFGSAPLRYLRSDQGYVLYSVGVDGHNNGGRERTDGMPPGRQYDLPFTVER